MRIGIGDSETPILHCLLNNKRFGPQGTFSLTSSLTYRQHMVQYGLVLNTAGG